MSYINQNATNCTSSPSYQDNGHLFQTCVAQRRAWCYEASHRSAAEKYGANGATFQEQCSLKSLVPANTNETYRHHNTGPKARATRYNGERPGVTVNEQLSQWDKAPRLRCHNRRQLRLTCKVTVKATRAPSQRAPDQDSPTDDQDND